MCVLVFAHNFHKKFKFIFAGNRDEFYDRPTKPSEIWGDEIKILSGIDLKSKGTWLGITIKRNDGVRPGDFVVVTNYRDFYNFKDDKIKRSRGLIALDFLLNKYRFNSIENRFQEFGYEMISRSKEYNAFNLIYGNFDKLYYYSNVKNQIERIPDGIHGLSNNFLNVPWPKLHWAKLRFADIIQNSTNIESDLLNLFHDQTQFDDDLLPDTGVGIERERLLSSIFIKSEIYGTRSTTLIFVDYYNNLKFIERNYEGGSYFDRQFELKLSL